MGKRLFVNCKTGEETLVECDAEFLAQLETDRLAFAAKQAELDAIPTTQEEIEALKERIADLEKI